MLATGLILPSFHFTPHNTLHQATIGIDFLSKTMYLEDRTVLSGKRLVAIVVFGLGGRGGRGEYYCLKGWGVLYLG